MAPIDVESLGKLPVDSENFVPLSVIAHDIPMQEFDLSDAMKSSTEKLTESLKTLKNSNANWVKNLSVDIESPKTDWVARNSLFQKPLSDYFDSPFPFEPGSAGWYRTATPDQKAAYARAQPGLKVAASDGIDYLSPVDSYLHKIGADQPNFNTVEFQVAPQIQPFVAAAVPGGAGLILRVALSAQGSAQVGYAIREIQQGDYAGGGVDMVAGGLTVIGAATPLPAGGRSYGNGIRVPSASPALVTLLNIENSAAVGAVDQIRVGANSGPSLFERLTQNAGINAEDATKIAAQLGKSSVGADLTTYISGGQFEGVGGYSDLLLQIKKPTMQTSVLQAFKVGEELQTGKSGALFFEQKTANYDIDVGLKSDNGAITDAYQLKTVKGIKNIANNVNGAADQLVNAPANNKVINIDVREGTHAEFQSSGREQGLLMNSAKYKGMTINLNFPDGVKKSWRF